MGREVGRLQRQGTRHRLWALLALVGVWGATPAWGADAVLAADAHVNSAMPTVNSGAISNLDVGGGYTTLLQFDLSALPVGTTAGQVQRAVLRLYANRVTAAGQVTYAPINSAWGEYSVTYATEPAVGAAAGTFGVTQAGSFIAVDVTALVQGWIANAASNNGIALTAATAVAQFDSKENDLTAHPAMLEVDLVNQGPAGATGPAGPQGPQGLAGVAGAQGLQGLTGPMGPAGVAGPTGAQGAMGPAGPAGASGATGAVGPMGPQGPVGATGPTGPQGPAGSSGSGLSYEGNYSSTTNYALGDVVLWQGSSYMSLVAGNHGNTPSASPEQWGMLSAQGPVGATGATGAVGPAGPQGLPGTQGVVGPAGPQGVQGIAGQAGAQGIPGATGAIGPSGPMGPEGPAGPVGMTWQGAYSSTTNYALADAVSYNGSGYVSLVASNHGNTPDQSPEQWALFAAAGTQGATGPAGAIGATGPVGLQGPQGATGTTGATGAMGPQGPPVANYLGNYQSAVNYAFADAVSWQGSTYISLVSANHGNTPDQSPTYWAVLAAQGPAGTPGAPGVAGPAGPTGSAGAAGAMGPQGPPVTFLGEWLVGTEYAVGEAVAFVGSSYIALAANAGREPDVSPAYWGLLAAAGAVGATGAQGPQGLQGPTGYAGATGPMGPQGAAGPTGTQGPQGPPGETGAQGLQGATGPAGTTGAMGPPGANGTNGVDGAAGPPGMIFRGTWLSGYGYATNDAVSYGTPASTYIALVANSSSEPDVYPQVWAVLAQAGSVGPSGPVGAAATVTVGTVTTGAPGSQATVMNSGTSSAAVLNFTIPQGAPGPPGSGGGGGGTSGIQGAGVYHSVQNNLNYPYYSVSNPNSSATETGLTASAYAALTWVPVACTATALNVFSQQNNTISVTLRVGSNPANMANTTMACGSVARGTSCNVTGTVPIPAGSFVDLIIGGADSSPMPVWTSLTCQ